MKFTLIEVVVLSNLEGTKAGRKKHIADMNRPQPGPKLQRGGECELLEGVFHRKNLLPFSANKRIVRSFCRQFLGKATPRPRHLTMTLVSFEPHCIELKV